MTVYVNGRFLTEEPTGVQRFAQQLILGLSDVRDDVVLLAPPGARPLESPKVQVHEIGSVNPLRWEQWDLPRWLQQNGRPLLVNLGNRAPVLYRHQVSSLHDLLPMRFHENFSLRFRLQFRFVAAVGVVRRSHRVVTVSEAAESEIRSYYGLPPSKTAVVYNAVGHRTETASLDGTPSAIAIEAPYALAFGRAGAHRNSAVCIEAMLKIVERSSLSLVLVGSPDPLLMRLAEPLGSRCVFTGRISDGELDELYRGAHVFIAPSRYEGFDIPPLEAQGAGVPVFASDIPVHHEVLGNGALYFDPSRPHELAALLGQVESDPALRRELVTRGDRNFTRFDWQASAMSLSRLIDEVLSGPRR